MIQPPNLNNLYNQSLCGHFGEFGSGNNIQIYYLQTALTPDKLDKISLISDIQGSECWPVRNLFQREVDTKRVSTSLLPYLQSADKVKFFNPLTLTLLPIDRHSNELITEVPYIESTNLSDANGNWTSMEVAPYYRFRYINDNPHYSLMEWNDTNLKIVAIDGQHRLSALKRFHADVANDPSRRESFMKWTIPVVIFGLRAIDQNAPRSSMLSVTRNIFVYINTQARTPNKARVILLSDESINDICTQELLQYSHENDILDIEDRSATKLPLLFYDWRGEEESGVRIHPPASIKPIEEIADWFECFLLGDDFSDYQRDALQIEQTNELNSIFITKKLSPVAAEKIRTIFREEYLPGLAFFLENFIPFKNYTDKLRKFESSKNEESDVARHAFHELRFGTNSASDDLQKYIRDEYDVIVDELMDIKDNCLQGLIAYDIGMRGVISAFADLKEICDKSLNDPMPWIEYCQFAAKVFNKIYEDGWFDMSHSNKSIDKLMKHITRDHTDTIVNYKLSDIDNALGSFLSIIATAYGHKLFNEIDSDTFEDIWSEYADYLNGTLLKGYKKEVKAQLLMDEYTIHSQEYKDRLKDDSLKCTSKHLKQLRTYLDSL